MLLRTVSAHAANPQSLEEQARLMDELVTECDGCLNRDGSIPSLKDTADGAGELRGNPKTAKHKLKNTT